MKGFRKYLALFSLSLSGGSIYVLPYLKYVFYEPQLVAMGINNEQLGFLLTLYAIGCMVLYIPGGILADRVDPRKALALSLFGTSILGVTFALTFNYLIAEIVWLLFAVTTGFVFWAALIKAIRILGEPHEQGRLYGIYYAGNGLTAAAVNAIALWAFGLAGDQVAGLRAAVLVSAAATAIVAVLVLIFLKDVRGEQVQTDEADKFEFKHVGVVIRNPLVWLISFTILCTYGLYTSTSYFNPYLVDVVGVPLQDSAALGIIRTYVFMLFAPLGGLIADRVTKSTSKWFIIGFSILGVLFGSTLLLSSGISSTVAVILSLLPGAFALMMYGVMFSTVEECRIPRYMTGTVVGIASIIGYLPDFFFNTLFGSWLDRFGNDGYRYIFLFLVGLSIFGVVLSVGIRIGSLKVAQKAKAAVEGAVSVAAN